MPLGGIPLSMVLGPLTTSTRSAISTGTRKNGARPYMPLSATSALTTGKPRREKSSLRLVRALPICAEGSLLSTSATLRACWSRMVFSV